MIQKLISKLQADLILLGAFLLGIILFIALFHLYFWNKIYPGVRVVNINLGGKTVQEAKGILDQVVVNPISKVKLKLEQQVWEINLTNLGFNYLPVAASQKAYLIGRSGNFLLDCQNKLSVFKKGVSLDFDYQLNEALLNEAIAAIAAQIDVPAILPSIQLTKINDVAAVQVMVGKTGKKLEQEKLKTLISQHLGQLIDLTIDLPIQILTPEISSQAALLTKGRAEKFLGKTLELGYEENSWKLNEAELINLLNFDNGFDNDKIKNFVSQLSTAINRPAQNALFRFQNGRVSEFKPAKDGLTLNVEKSAKTIDETLFNLEKSASTSAKMTLIVNLSKPAITNEAANNLGIKELIGFGESWFYGSITNRMHNIELASSRLNGALIIPGETFSFNQTLGDVSPETGFQQAYIIKEGRTVLGDGGGVCQVSTTLFRAALAAGLPIIERKAHAYRVSYYEQNSQVGIDATVFSPTDDLKFKNDTPAHILIQTTYDQKNMKLTFELYGTNDGRKVSLSNSRVWEQTAPPPDLYQDDPTLPNGVVKQVDWKAWGAKVAFDYKVTRNDEVLQDRTFYSYYKPWQAVFLRGTAGQ